jgi:uncharacterized protein
MARLIVEVVYASPRDEDAIRVTVPGGATLREAIEASGILARHPEIDPARCRVGVFGRERAQDAPVCAGDRIEIYRALRVDPKEARRKRVARARRP